MLTHVIRVTPCEQSGSPAYQVRLAWQGAVHVNSCHKSDSM